MNTKTILFALMGIVAVHITVTLNPAVAIRAFAGDSYETQKLADQYTELNKERAFLEAIGADRGTLDDLQKKMSDLEKKLMQKPDVIGLAVPPDLYANDLQRIINEALDLKNRNKLPCRFCVVRSEGGSLVFESFSMSKEMVDAVTNHILQIQDERRQSGEGNVGFPPPPGGRCPPGMLPYGQGCVRDTR